jgi:hypothetical protein
MRTVKMRSAFAASSISTRFMVRVSGFMVVSQSWPASFPQPFKALYRIVGIAGKLLGDQALQLPIVVAVPVVTAPFHLVEGGQAM